MGTKVTFSGPEEEGGGVAGRWGCVVVVVVVFIAEARLVFMSSVLISSSKVGRIRTCSLPWDAFSGVDGVLLNVSETSSREAVLVPLNPVMSMLVFGVAPRSASAWAVLIEDESMLGVGEMTPSASS